MHAREVKERHVELCVDAPHVTPVALREELNVGELARHPAIERGLHPPRKGLEAEHHVRPQLMERSDGLQLPAVMLSAVVGLPQQDDGALRRGRQHLLAAERLRPSRRDPGGDRHASRRGRLAGAAPRQAEEHGDQRGQRDEGPGT